MTSHMTKFKGHMTILSDGGSGIVEIVVIWVSGLASLSRNDKLAPKHLSQISQLTNLATGKSRKSQLANLCCSHLTQNQVQSSPVSSFCVWSWYDMVFRALERRSKGFQTLLETLRTSGDTRDTLVVLIRLCPFVCVLLCPLFPLRPFVSVHESPL
jgi:hypothetical protein